MSSKLLIALTVPLALASMSMDANARRFHRAGYSRVTGRTPNYSTHLLGLRKQTRTGGPAGGQTSSGGGS